MDFDHLLFSGLAFRRMMERGISPADVEFVLHHGEIIEGRPDGHLVLGFVKEEPLHVVAFTDKKSRTCIVITAYYPDPKLWDRSFRARRLK